VPAEVQLEAALWAAQLAILTHRHTPEDGGGTHPAHNTQTGGPTHALSCALVSCLILALNACLLSHTRHMTTRTSHIKAWLAGGLAGWLLAAAKCHPAGSFRACNPQGRGPVQCRRPTPQLLMQSHHVLSTCSVSPVCVCLVQRPRHYVVHVGPLCVCVLVALCQPHLRQLARVNVLSTWPVFRQHTRKVGNGRGASQQVLDS